MRAFAPIVLVLLAVAGCTPMAYQKAGVTSDRASVEEMECRSMAAREATPPLWYWRPYYGWRRPYFGDPMLSRMQEEAGLSDFCMRSRGYQLVPVPSNPS